MSYKQSMMQAPASQSGGKSVVQCNAPLHVQPENKFPGELLAAILNDNVKHVEEAISSVMHRNLCNTILCISCEKGSLNIVKSLANKFRDLCLLVDEFGRIPLLIAIIEGKAEIVRELVRACPESLDYVTPQGETIIDFALKSAEPSCLDFLRQEIHRLNKHCLLNPPNDAKAVPFEIDTPRNSVQEVKFAMAPNAWRLQDKRMPNERGEAMDGPASNYSLSGNPNKGKETTKTSQMQSSLLLTGMVFTAGATYAGLYNYPNIFPLNDNTKHLGRFNAKDVLFSPRLLPDGFWFLTVTTFTFVSSVVSILVAICLDGGKCAFGVRAVSSFVLTALFISFVMMVERLVPHFVVIFGNGHILTGFEMLCLYTLLLALISLVVALMARLLWSFVRRS